MMSQLGRHLSSRGHQRAHEQTTATRKSSARRTGNAMTGRSSSRYPYQRLHIAVGIAVALVGIGFRRTDAFFLSATARGVGTRLSGARTAARSLGIDVGSLAGVSRRRARGLIMALEGGMCVSRHPAPDSRWYSWKDVPWAGLGWVSSPWFISTFEECRLRYRITRQKHTTSNL